MPHKMLKKFVPNILESLIICQSIVSYLYLSLGKLYANHVGYSPYHEICARGRWIYILVFFKLFLFQTVCLLLMFPPPYMSKEMNEWMEG